MGILTPEMKEAVPRIRLAFVATVSPDGKPNLSAAAPDFWTAG
jgi:predicted pyridoxine 5'-phosphate oxidase superfamily flavin-nucleotide-binding protein